MCVREREKITISTSFENRNFILYRHSVLNLCPFDLTFIEIFAFSLTVDITLPGEKKNARGRA